MPISPHQAADDSFSDEVDASVLIKELRKKSVKIYDLEEKLEEKDSRIYSMEYERSRMKMTFDKLRIELHNLKEQEREYQQMLVLTSPKRSVKNELTQTDDIDILQQNERMSRHVNRELTFTGDLTAIVNQSLNQTQFSEVNNTSSDNLIPLPEMSTTDDIDNITRVLERASSDGDMEQKKSKKKLRGFLKLMSCVSK